MSNVDLFTYEQVYGVSIRQKYPWMKEKDFVCVTSIEQLDTLIDQAIASGLCSLDTETSGLDTRVYSGVCKNYIVGFSFCFDGKTGYYVPINHGTEDPETKVFKRRSDKNLDPETVKRVIQKLIDNCVLIFHNTLYDHEIMEAWGYKIRCFVGDPNAKPPKIAFHDTMIMARLNDASSKQIGLKFLADHHLNMKMLELDKDIFAKGEDIKFQILDPTEDRAVVYAASDAICTYHLYQLFKHVETEQRLVYNVERRVTFAVRQLERNKCLVDKEKLHQYKAVLDNLMKKIEREAYELVGDPINLASTKQVGDVLVNKFNLKSLIDPEEKDSKTGEFKIHTDSEYLEPLKKDCPLIRLILMHRDISKTIGTYIQNLLDNTDENNEIKFQFKPTGTDTGRFSSPGGKPEDGYGHVNIQAMTRPTDEEGIKGKTIEQVIEEVGSGYILRSAIKARPGRKIAALDYSGEELRVAANLSREPIWIKEFIEGDQDLHTITARLAYSVEKPTKGQRNDAKTLNFQTVYGGGPRAVSEALGITKQEAKVLQSKMIGGLKALKVWMEKEKAEALKRGYALTPFGRRRPLQIIDPSNFSEVARAERLAVNTPVQGAGADIMKIAMVRCHDYCMQYPSEVFMLLTIHDELVFEIAEDKLDTHLPALMNLMSLEDLLKGSLKWAVPLSLDCEVGASWNVEYEFFEENPNCIAKLNTDLRKMKARQFNLDQETFEPIKKEQPAPVGQKVAEQKELEVIEVKPKRIFNLEALSEAKKLIHDELKNLDPAEAFERALDKYFEICPPMMVDENKEVLTGTELMARIQEWPYSWRKYCYVMQNEMLTIDKFEQIKHLVTICKGGNNPFIIKDKMGNVFLEGLKIDAVKFEILANHYNI